MCWRADVTDANFRDKAIAIGRGLLEYGASLQDGLVLIAKQQQRLPQDLAKALGDAVSRLCERCHALPI